MLRLLVVALLLASPIAAAQSPQVDVAIDDVPSGQVSTNDTFYLEPFTVALSVQNVICSSATSFTFIVEASAEPSNASGNRTIGFTTVPNAPSITVPQGQHVVQAFEGSTEAALEVRPSSIPALGLSVPITFSATLRPVTSGCQGNGPIQGESPEQELTIRFGRGTEDPILSPTPTVPGPGWILLALAVVTASALRRRRRA